MGRVLTAAAAAGAFGCGTSTAEPRRTPPAGTTRSAPAATATTTTATSTTATQGATAAAAAPTATACGELGCRAFSTPEEALLAVLAEEEPRILAVGEAHAQRGSEGVPSATRRFTEQLLPLLRERARDIVLELPVASGRCGASEKRIEATVRRSVTAAQAESNKPELVTLGERARALGIEAHVLRPTCEDFATVARAGGDQSVLEMLTLVTRLTAEALERLVFSRGRAGDERLVVSYGGAMHNDVSPAPGREAWSFGARLRERTGGRYVELDIIVPEYIRDTDSWRRLRWVAHYDRARLGSHATLFKLEPGSYVLVFAATATP